jgi:PLP dependent protein
VTTKEALAIRLGETENRIAAACNRAGRARSDVTLVAVTKTISGEIAALLPDLGIQDLGESRPQELWKKAAAIPDARWHLIGHLQRNKIDQTLPHVHLLHSIDSLRLLAAIDDSASRLGKAVDGLLEFNLSREPQKHGFTTDDVPSILGNIAKLNHVRIRGLMTMAPLSDDAERSRPVFSELRQLRDRLRESVRTPHTLEHLSMGMSQDFEVAIEEGATLIRIGSALFEDLS